MKRNKFSTLFEIFYPVSMFLLIYTIRKTFDKHEFEFSEHEGTTDYYRFNRTQLSAIDYSLTDQGNIYTTKFNGKTLNEIDIDIINKIFNTTYHDEVKDNKDAREEYESLRDKYSSLVDFNFNLTYMKIPMVLPFNVCSIYNEDSIFKYRIGYIIGHEIPEPIRKRFIKDSDIGRKLAYILKYKYNVTRTPTDFQVTEKSFKNFSSVKSMEDYVEGDEYMTPKGQRLCFALHLEKRSEKSNKFHYSLHFADFESTGRVYTQDIPMNHKGLWDDFQNGPDLKSFEIYENGLYNYVLKVVNEYILQTITGNENATINYAITPMNYIESNNDEFGEFFASNITIIMCLAFMVPLSLYIYKMVYEKESRVKEGMKIMGLDEGIYYLSYFIQYVLNAGLIAFLSSFILRLVYKKIPIFFLNNLIFLFALDIFALVIFFQSFIDRTRIAVVLSLILYFMMQCASIPVLHESASLGRKITLGLIPLVNLNIGNSLLSKFQYHYRKFKFRDLMKDHYNYSLGLCYLMFLIDFNVFIFIGFYLQNVLPHDYGIRRPWYFLCSQEYWCKGRKKKYSTFEDKQEFDEYKTGESKKLEEERKTFRESRLSRLSKMKARSDIYGRSTKFESEKLYDDRPDEDVFEIRGIVKVFGDGKRAVDGVNLNFYKDEIFALLGHNGAGKTTLISMLTGLYESTAGKAVYNGMNVLDSNNMGVFREVLGICPQHDTLFEDLTVREHLEMFSIFKGVKEKDVKEEVNRVLRDFIMTDIQDMLAKNLSAGNRRKLSIAISLIGGSQVIFLDEPSSGMDITSRRNLWEILKRQTDGKIIILTTHYMEEASVLGKRIGIINAGRMKCIGSPLFLIEKYGKFMSLNITKESNADTNAIVDFITSLSKNIEYEILSEEIMFRIPVKDDNNEQKKLMKCIDIPKFFKELDDNITDLKIKSYSVSMPTLEDVFLNIAAEDTKALNEKLREENKEDFDDNNQLLSSTDLKGEFTPSEKFKSDFISCVRRRYIITSRDFKGFVMEILGPILLVLFGLCIAQMKIKEETEDEYVDNLEFNEDQTILYSGYDGLKKEFFYDPNKNIKFEIKDIKEKDTPIYDIPYNDTADYNMHINEQKDIVTKSFYEEVSEKVKKYEEDSDIFDDDYQGYYAGFLQIHGNENNDFHYEYNILLNLRIKHGVMVYSNYLFRSIFQDVVQNHHYVLEGDKPDIKFHHEPFPLTSNISEENEISNHTAILFFFSIAFGIMPANFIIILVNERINNSKHLMRLSGINIFAYWISNYLFEFVKYYLTAGICLLLLKAFDYYEDYLYIFYLLYGPGMISLTYAMSFHYEDEADAQNGVILMNLVFGSLGSIITLLFRTQDKRKKFGKKLEIVLCAIPVYCFDFAYNVLMNKQKFYAVDYTRAEAIYFSKDKVLKEWNLCQPLYIFAAAECFIYTVLFIVAEVRAYAFKDPTRELLFSKIKDSEVKKEIEFVNSNQERLLPGDHNETEGDSSNSTRSSNFAVKVRNLRKAYKSGCMNKKETMAIENLNFCIEPGECFGLLGLNGAGKTTTFKCITQELAPDNGEIYIFGKDSKGRFNELNDLFGYCPQFDAVFKLLSVYENLEFYARIKGIKPSLIEQLVKSMIREMSLGEFKNKLAGRLSGGNRRKLSVAISMIGNPPIILLDEPSTGLDPEARRFMWNVIHKMSTRGRKSSVIMTTHSMDEAETLCRRMGIMVNGEFVCLGTANQIKDKYGYGYEADIRIKPIPPEKQEEILKGYGLEPQMKVTLENYADMLNTLKKPNYAKELRNGRFGDRVKKAMSLNGEITLGSFLNWIFFTENALKFIRTGKDYFSEIICSEHIENNFLFRLKKGKEQKSIGFFFGLFDESKDECNITEYSIQQTSLEQIFNKFASRQGKKAGEIDEDEEEEADNRKGIKVDDEVYNNLISESSI